MDIRGARALVTGATGGIGQEIATRLHGLGASVLVTGRRSEELDALVAALPGSRAIVADLVDPVEVDRLLAEIGPIDLLVANAALPATGRLEAFTTEELDRALAVNLRAPMVLAHGVLPGMLERGSGHIVLISSIAGKMPTARLSVYVATKYALRGFGASLRQDLAGTGVSASVVFPGSVIDGGMLTDAGLGVPQGTKGTTVAAVADAVVRAVEHDRGEVDAAELLVRAVAKAVGVVPSLADRLGRQRLTQAYGEELAEKLRHKR